MRTSCCGIATIPHSTTNAATSLLTAKEPPFFLWFDMASSMMSSSSKVVGGGECSPYPLSLPAAAVAASSTREKPNSSSVKTAIGFSNSSNNFIANSTTTSNSNANNNNNRNNVTASATRTSSTTNSTATTSANNTDNIATVNTAIVTGRRRISRENSRHNHQEISSPSNSNSQQPTRRNSRDNTGAGSAASATPSRRSSTVNSPLTAAAGAAGSDDCIPDFERLVSTNRMLETSGFYYGKLSWQEASALLRNKPVGTFLVRDSLDSRFLYALTVQTEREPTSVRIHYSRGQFKLDAEQRLQDAMPLFDCVVELVEFYVKLSGTPKAIAHVWMDEMGRKDLPIRLVTPLYHDVPSLQHLCRRAINGSRARHAPQQRISNLGEALLPKPLLEFVRQYPYER